MTNIKAREEILTAIRNHGPFKSASLPAFLSQSYTPTVISKAVDELILLERIAVSKERQLTAR